MSARRLAGLATLVALTYVTPIATTPASATDAPDIRSASVAPRVFDPLVHDGRRDRTTFTFAITGSGNVRVDVLTHSRRIIRTRRFGVLPAGGYRWRWNGRKSSGGMAPQGRYVIRLTTGAGATTAAVTRNVVLASPLLTTRTIDRAALRQTGKPYVWGATGPASFDCSGLTQWSYRMAGIRLLLEELARDAGTTDMTTEGGVQVTARLDAASQAQEDKDLDFWLDMHGVQVFDPESGENLTL